MAEQKMPGRDAQDRIDAAALRYMTLFDNDEWSLEHAYAVLTTFNSPEHNLNLFEVAGLAKALACYQSSAEQSDRNI